MKNLASLTGFQYDLTQVANIFWATLQIHSFASRRKAVKSGEKLRRS